MSVAGRYLASEIYAGRVTIEDQLIEVQQTDCHVNAVVPNFGSLECTAQAPGTLPRVDGCVLHVGAWCPLAPEQGVPASDDGSSIRLEVYSRWSACHGNSNGGTIVFGMTLTPN